MRASQMAVHLQVFISVAALLMTTAHGQSSPLQYLALGSTVGVAQVVLPRTDDGSSDEIPISGGFPFGGTAATSVYMGTNGYFSFMRSVTYCCPEVFPYSDSHNNLVAPFWADIDNRLQGTISYEVHSSGSGLLAQVNSFLMNQTGTLFSGSWMVIGEWLQVQQYSRTGPGQPENTFQGILVTDGSTSYAVFIYNCDQMEWGGGATIGYHAEGDFYENHELTGSESANNIACVNEPDSAWSNVVYRLTVSVPQVSIRTQPSDSPFQAATRIYFACDVDSELEVTYQWTGYCTSQGGSQLTLLHSTSTPPGQFSLWISSTLNFCLDVITCTVTSSLGTTGQASYQISSDDITGAGLWGASQPLPSNSAIVADESGQIGNITCYSAARGSLIGQWLGPSGTDITTVPTDPFAIDLHAAPYFASFISFGLYSGQSFAASDQGVYSCVIPDESGVEQTLNIGIYPYEYPNTIAIEHVRRISQDPLTITCASTGMPATTVVWAKGSTMIVDDATYQTSQTITDRATSSYNNTLTIGGAVDDATGIYSCTVATEIHDLLSNTSDPKSLGVRHYIGMYRVGTTQIITCSIDNAVSISWLYNGDQVVTSGAGSSLALFLVTNDTVHHRLYICRGFQADLSYRDVYLTIIVYALSVVVGDSGMADVGQEKSLYCLASETVGGLVSTATLQWIDEDGSPVSSGGGVTVGEPTSQTSGISLSLTFNSLRVSHAGRYTCEASLSSPALETLLVKSTTTDVSLQIPTPTVDLSSSTGSPYSGGSETLTCSIQLNSLVDSPVTVSTVWRKDGGMLTGSDKIGISQVQQVTSSLYKATLTISDLRQISDAGTYSCEAFVAANPTSPFIGNSSAVTASLTLAIQAPPLSVSVSPTSLTILDTSPYNTVYLQCTATAPDGVLATKTFQWIRTVSGSGTMSVLTSGGTTSISNSGLSSSQSTSDLTTVEDTPGTHTYTCTVTLLLEEGTDVVASAAASVEVKGPAAPAVPENIEATVTSFTTALVQWSVPNIAYTPEQYTVEYGTNSLTLSQSSAVVHGATDISAVDQQYSVKITGLQEGSTYYYRVVAQNTIGTTSTNLYTVTVEEVPVILSVGGPSSAVAGESFTLNCTAVEEEDVTGTPVLTWSGPSGTILQSGGDVTLGATMTSGSTTSSTLQLNPLRLSHSGEYSCHANISGVGFTDTATYQLTVIAGALPVSVSSTSTEYSAASPVTLTCDAVSGAVAPVTYLWTSTCSGDCFINGQTSATVSSSALRAVDSGNHTCTVTDSVGNTGHATTDVSVRGVGLYSSRHGQVTNNSLLIASGDNTIGSLRCISGSMTPNIGQWLAPDGQDLAQSSAYPFTVTVGGHSNPGYIEIAVDTGPGLTSSDQGVYSCVIPDEAGVEHLLYIGVYPNGFNSPPSIASLEHGSTADSAFALTCTSTGSPATNVSWSKDGILISSDDTYTISQTLTDGTTSTYENSLTIRADLRDLDGTYTCRVANTINAVEQSVTINGLQISGMTFFTLGASETVTCSTDLDGTSTEWLYDGEVVVSSSGPEAQLVFSPVNDRIHNRNYICRSVTPYGHQEQSVTTRVQVVPDDFEVIITSDGDTSHAGQEFTLTCTVVAVEGLLQLPQVEWLDSSRRLIVSEGDITVSNPVISGLTTTTTLQFSPLRLSHNGEVVCRANIISMAPPYNISKEAEWELIVEDPPFEVVVNPPSVEGLTSETITLTCTATAHDSVLVHKSFHWSRSRGGEAPTELTDNGDTVMITNSNLNAPTSTSQLTIFEDTAGRYQFTCNATLQFSGVKDDISLTYSANVIITGPSAPSELTNITVTEISFESARVSWTTISIAYSSESHVVQFSTDPVNLAQESASVVVTETGRYSVEVVQLIPGTTYYFKVVATNSFGIAESEQGMFATELIDGAPSATPVNFVTEVAGPTSLTFSWGPPPADQQNGDILSYTISCSPAHVTSLTYQAAGTQTVGGFTPATNYTCTVHASNTNGNGPAASDTRTTLDGVPGMVANVTYESLSAKMIQLTWKEPLIPNGTIVSYHIVVNYYEDSTPAYSNTVHASGELSDEISSLDPYVPYKVFIAARNSNPTQGENTVIIAFSKEGVPSIAPAIIQTTRLSGTQMSVSYAPLTLVQARGFIVHYVVEYEPKVGSRRRKRQAMRVLVAPEESHVIISGLNPKLSYTVSVSAATIAGQGPATASVIEVPCSKIFQLLLSTVHDCHDWRFTDTEEKLNDISMEIMPSIENHCKCSVTPSTIADGEFRCLEDHPTAVMYRGVLTAGMPSECASIVSRMMNWTSSGKASIVVQGNRLDVNPNCMVEIESITSDIECSPPSSEPGEGSSSGTSVIPIVAGGIVGAVALVVVVILAIAIFIWWLRQQGRFKSRRIPRVSERQLQRVTTPVDVNNAYGEIRANGAVELQSLRVGGERFVQNAMYDGRKSDYIMMHPAGVICNLGEDGEPIYDVIKDPPAPVFDEHPSLRKSHNYENM